MWYDRRNIKNILFYVLSTCLLMEIILLVIPEQGLAQPGLPNDPEQTPIDGGLGILAVLDGTYAIKKTARKRIVFSDSTYFLYLQ